jgi:serine/threonine-protein kinase
VPLALSEIVMRCLAKGPTARYARGYDLADALIGYLRGAPDATTTYRSALMARRPNLSPTL